MKVVFLSDDFPPQSFGGAGISTYRLAKGIKDIGHDVVVITTCRSQNEVGETNYNGLKIYKIYSNYPSHLRSYLSLNNPKVVKEVDVLLKAIKPDIVHANNIHFYLSYKCILIAKRHAKAVVFTARDVMTFNYGKLHTEKYLKHFDYHTSWLDHIRQAKKRWNPFRNILIRRYLGRADKIFSVSIALKNALIQNGINNVDVIHTGEDVQSWISDEDNAKRLRSKYNLQGKKIILFGGRLSKIKGSIKVLDAISKIVESVPNVILLSVGKVDENTEEMKKRAKQLNLENHLVFTGWIGEDKIKNVYAVADLVLVPSICFDAFPRVVIEAMACGKPVIGTCYGGAPEIISDGITGYTVNPFDVDQMSKKIIELLRDIEKSKQFGKAGRELVLNKFSLRSQVEKYDAWYQKLTPHILKA